MRANSRRNWPAGWPRGRSSTRRARSSIGTAWRPLVERLLTDLGFALQPFSESHLCCGSAGTYSVLQPEIAGELRDRKLAELDKADPDLILSANVGCLAHLQGGTATPVMHWIVAVDAALSGRRVND